MRLARPRLPSAALGLSGDGAAAVALDRRRGNLFSLRRAAHVTFPDNLVRPDFNEVNIPDLDALGEVLIELVTSVGMLNRRRWSIALPEAATRTAIITVETAPESRAELDDVLRWKIERAMATPLGELRASRERLTRDAQGRARYLVTCVRLDVLAEYEAVFGALGWQAGLILPRHMGEAWWLMNAGAPATDALLVSTHRNGFTAVLMRNRAPLIVRSVACEREDRADELYRFLLFYRDRLAVAAAPPSGDADAGDALPAHTIEHLLIAGSEPNEQEASAVVAETLSVTPRTLGAQDVNLALPEDGLDFHLIAAPAGLAALAWA